MKVALVTEFFYPTIGGCQTFVAGLAEGLGKRGDEVRVIAPLLDWASWPSQPGQVYSTKWIRFWTWPPRLGYLIVQLRLVVELVASDVIHLVHPAFGLGAWLAAKAFRKRLVVTLMGYDTYDFVSLPVLKQKIALAVCQQADAVTAPSADLARLARSSGVVRDIQVIPLLSEMPAAADPDRVEALRDSLGVKAGVTVFVAVQRHYPVKEPHVFLDAWQRLSRPDCLLVLVGGGELEASLRHEVERLDLRNVVLVGEVPRGRVRSYLALADVFIHHSRYESFGLGILEAMQVGLPVIACDVGAVPEIVTDGVDGLLIPPSNPVAMADAVVRLADSSQLRARLATAARKRAHAFGSAHLVARYQQLYQGEMSS